MKLQSAKMNPWEVALAVIIGGLSLWLLCWRRNGGKQRFQRRVPGTADEPVTYNMKEAQGGPVVSGRAVLIASRFVNSIIGSATVKKMFMRKSNVLTLRGILMEDVPTQYPLVPCTTSQNPGPLDLESILSKAKDSPESNFRHKGIYHFYEGYRSGKFTPSDVAERAIGAIEASENMQPKLRAFIEFHKDQIRKAARESTERYARNQPLSVLDGVPIGVKDEIKVADHHLRMGSSFVGHITSKEDAEGIRRLRAKGALILGVTNMQEHGMGTTGINVSKYHGTPRNPYNVNHFTGGSSSGSAVAVAAGLCPVAIGTDGGGSIRLPATFCGVVGFKPTYGRISLKGSPILAHTVGVVGPLSATVRDAAITYALMAGPFASDELSLHQPPVDLEGFDAGDLKGLRLGIDFCLFKHADPEIVSCCEKAVRFLESRGAEVVAVQIPELEESRVAHIITILSEMRSSLQEAFWNHYDDQYFENSSLLSIAEDLKTIDYIQAQRQKTRTMGFLKDIFKKVDVLLSPGSAIVAPKIIPAYLKHGFSDTSMTADILRHVFLANLIGTPAMTVPVGYSGEGLPISLQIMGAWWEESTVLRVARITEEFLQHKARPQVYFELLD